VLFSILVFYLFFYLKLSSKEMSRHIQKKNELTIAYGFDPTPLGGYFFQVFKEKGEDEEFIVNEGFVKGISRTKMLGLMTKWEIKNRTHLLKVALDLPF
jgi:hypothetical protein